MKSFRNNDDAFTGLEAAIVLIAFVVVAAVFSYVVLGAGFFTTQKSQEVVHTGVAQASSTLEIVGNVYGVGFPGSTTTSGSVVYVNFTVALAPGGTPVDFEKMAITFSNSTQLEPIVHIATWTGEPTTGHWAITAVQNDRGTNNNLLEGGEQFSISLMPTGGLPKNDQFNVEIKPSIGASLDIKRTVPAALNTVNILY
jgi:flagellin FlaB